MAARLIKTTFFSIFALVGIVRVVLFFALPEFNTEKITQPGGAASLKIECNIVSDISHAVDSIRESAAAIKSFADSLSRFFETVGSAISFIGSLIGAKALLLLAGAMIFSALLSMLGVPKGKLSFFISLICADCIWAAWRRSFENIDSGFVWEMIKANLILIAPFLVIHLIKGYYPYLTRALSRMYGRIAGKNKGMTKEEAVSFWERYKAIQSDFERALMDDIVAGGEDGVVVSDETKRCAMEMQKIFESIAGGTVHTREKEETPKE